LIKPALISLPFFRLDSDSPEYGLVSPKCSWSLSSSARP